MLVLVLVRSLICCVRSVELNSSEDAVKDKLISMQVAGTVLKLSASIYPPGSWQGTSSAEQTLESAQESWTIRSGLSNWAWRTLTELQDGKEERKS